MKRSMVWTECLEVWVEQSLEEIGNSLLFFFNREGGNASPPPVAPPEVGQLKSLILDGSI
jgi:hypothetical protein